MNIENINDKDFDTKDFLEIYENDYLKFHELSEVLSSNREVNLFMLLDKIFPNQHRFISEAVDDHIYIDIPGGAKNLIKTATDDQIQDLYRCGLTYGWTSWTSNKGYTFYYLC